tara:strand:- start:152 stop:472 length:321 start_codon:yes stop_codon:yes gene_type:complete
VLDISCEEYDSLIKMRNQLLQNWCQVSQEAIEEKCFLVSRMIETISVWEVTKNFEIDGIGDEMSILSPQLDCDVANFTKESVSIEEETSNRWQGFKLSFRNHYKLL